MTSYLQRLHTGYTAVRCLFEYGAKYQASVGAKTSEIARNVLFAIDCIDTSYIGWQNAQKMRQNDSRTEGERFYTDLAVKAVVVVALAALFVKGANKYLIPQLNPTLLLQKTAIPKSALDYTTEQVLETVTASWTKLTIENLTTGLFFIRTILNLQLARLTSHRLPLLNAALDAATTFKSAQYRTLEVKNSFAFLLNRIDYLFYPSRLYPKLSEFFKVPIKKVDAVFYLNTDGLSEQGIIEKIQSIYDYSQQMFHKSTWNRYWLAHTTIRDYYAGVVEPFDQAMTALYEFGLKYTISLQGTPPPAPIKVYIHHEDKIWRSFKGLDIFRWIPRFCVPGQKVPYIDRIEAVLSYPLTQFEKKLVSIQAFFEALARQNQ